MDDFTQHLNESLKDPQFKEEFEQKELRYKIVDILVGIRVQYKLTQSELAKKLGTTQTLISIIETRLCKHRDRLFTKTSQNI